MVDSIERCTYSTYCIHQIARWQLVNSHLASWAGSNQPNGENITKSYLSKNSYQDFLKNMAHLGFAVNVPRSLFLIGRMRQKVKLRFFLKLVPSIRLRKAKPPFSGLINEPFPTGEIHVWSR